MAEAAVSFALRTLSSLLVQEIKLLGQVRNGVRDIKLELERIRSFLKDADTRAAHEEEGRGRKSYEGVKTWVKQVREEAYQIEDVFDEYILKQAKLTHGRGLVRFLHKVYHLEKIQKLRHEIKNEIKNIKSSLAEIYRRETFYSFRNIGQGSSSGMTNVVPHESTTGSFFLKDLEVVGIESARNELIDLLVNGKSDRSVIAVVGEGGLGKTTLAGKNFNNDIIKKHFDCRAWIIVGKERMKKDLLRTIIQELYRPTWFGLREIEQMEEMDLINTLKKFLEDKCYIVVLDDMWKNDFWEDVKNALFDNNKSSRVMLTTRHKAVAYAVPFANVHMLESLPYDKALGLFCRKAFGSKLCCPPELEKLSHDILVKCVGILDIESVAPPPQCLQRLCLKGNIMKLSNWISELQNLIKVELSLRRSTDDVMRVLQALPNLLHLYLRATVCDEQLRFENGWFLKLKELFLCDFKRLKLLMIDHGALPNLRKLLIGPSPLKEIPIGIEHLRNLKILTFRLMLKEIYHMMKEENWKKVTNHIPEIHVSIKETYKSYFTYTTKYLWSMSPDDIKKLIEEYSQTKSKFGLPVYERTGRSAFLKRRECFQILWQIHLHFFENHLHFVANSD